MARRRCTVPHSTAIWMLCACCWSAARTRRPKPTCVARAPPLLGATQDARGVAWRVLRAAAAARRVQRSVGRVGVLHLLFVRAVCRAAQRRAQGMSSFERGAVRRGAARLFAATLRAAPAHFWPLLPSRALCYGCALAPPRARALQGVPRAHRIAPVARHGAAAWRQAPSAARFASHCVTRSDESPPTPRAALPPCAAVAPRSLASSLAHGHSLRRSILTPRRRAPLPPRAIWRYAVHEAARWHHPEVVRLLLEHGADKDAKNDVRRARAAAARRDGARASVAWRGAAWQARFAAAAARRVLRGVGGALRL